MSSRSVVRSGCTTGVNGENAGGTGSNRHRSMMSKAKTRVDAVIFSIASVGSDATTLATNRGETDENSEVVNCVCDDVCVLLSL